MLLSKLIPKAIQIISFSSLGKQTIDSFWLLVEVLWAGLREKKNFEVHTSSTSAMLFAVAMPLCNVQVVKIFLVNSHNCECWPWKDILSRNKKGN